MIAEIAQGYALGVCEVCGESLDPLDRWTCPKVR